MKITSTLTCFMLSLPQYLIVKLLDAYIVFCKVVFYTHLLYFFFVVAKKYLLTYLLRLLINLNASEIKGLYFCQLSTP